MDERFPQGNDLFRCRAINQFGELLKKIWMPLMLSFFLKKMDCPTAKVSD